MPDSQSCLPSFSSFAASFQNISSPFIKLNIPLIILEDVPLWHSTLAEGKSQSWLQCPPPISKILFAVDASTSGGVSVVLGQQWESWCLLEGWDSNGRKIGWAEMITVELGIGCLIQYGASNAHFWLHSDDMGIIFALDSRQSHSAWRTSMHRRSLHNRHWPSVWGFTGTLGNLFSLQTSQNFLIQKMLQKTLKICTIMPAFFNPGNGGKIWDLFKKFQLKKSWEKHRFP